MGSLDRSAASSFVYAKASGLLAKSFVGDNSSKLFSVRSLRELYSLLFVDETPGIPEVLLAKEIEQKAESKVISQYKNLISAFDNPSPILSEILSFYEYEHSDRNQNTESLNAENDRKKVMALWNSLSVLEKDDRENLKRLYKMEISFKNLIWALRLKVYYHFSNDEILDNLVYSTGRKNRGDVLVRETISVLSKDVASYDDWKNWKYAQFLNPHEEGVIWELDPRWIEKSLRNYLSKSYIKFFHKDPMSVTSMVSWFRIKQYELDCIRSVAEGLRLGVDFNS